MDPSYAYRRSVIWQIPKHQVQPSSYLPACITEGISLQKGLRVAAKAIQGFSDFVALGGRMTVRSSARVDGFYGAVSIQWAMRRQHKVPVLSEAVLMKNAREYLPGGLPISSWRWLVIRR